MNSNTAALQTGHHHHHQTSSNSANSQYHHPSVVNTSAQSSSSKPAVNPNPSVHRFNSLNDNNPWLPQSQAQQQGPTPPLRQHKRPAPHPPPPSTTISQQQSKANIHLSVNSTYNQPLHFSSAQTQTTPGLVPSTGGIHQQHSPKSPNQNFLHQSGSNLMSTSLSSASSSSMVNSHHHLPPSSQHQSLSTSLHHTTSNSLSNNNNNNNFDDLNLNGTSSISTASSSHQKKLEMKLNTMP